MAFAARLEEPPTARRAQAPGADRTRALRAALGEFWLNLSRAVGSRLMLIGLAFAALGGAAREPLAALISPYLVSLGLSSARIGDLLLFGAVPGMVLGALLGGRIADRLGPRRGIVLGQVTLVAGALIALVSGGQGPGELFFAALLLFYLATGIYIASSYALFMGLTDRALAATQFTSFMAMVNLCEIWSVRAAGALSETRGFAEGLAWLIPVGLLSLLLLARLPVEDRRRAHRAPHA